MTGRKELRDGCSAVRGQLPWFVGEDLGRERMATVAEHLLRCPSCRREASSLQQARKAIVDAGARTMRGGNVAGATDAMFTAMHAEIMQAALREPEAPVPVPLWKRGLLAAAALLLFGFGWWLVDGPGQSSRLDPSGDSWSLPGGGDLDRVPIVLPWAGERAQLRPLDFTDSIPESEGEASASERWGSGMLRRGRLRTLEEELLVPETPSDR